jgi:hypothetical protein
MVMDDQVENYWTRAQPPPGLICPSQSFVRPTGLTLQVEKLRLRQRAVPRVSAGENESIPRIHPSIIIKN